MLKSKSIRILIADDHAIIRQGLKKIVTDDHHMFVADEADNFSDMLKKVRNSDYDVVILDISMPRGDALDSLKQLKEENPELPVLILSIHSEEQYAVRMLKAGANGYLTKESAPEQLIEAIYRVAEGKKIHCPSSCGLFGIWPDKKQCNTTPYNPGRSRISSIY